MNEPAFENGIHTCPMRIYFEDTDAAGIVYYANYFKFAERARSEMMRQLGFESSRMLQNDGVALAVKSCHADYLKPAKLDDLVEVKTRIVEVRGASMKGEQRIYREDEELVNIGIRLVCITEDGKTARMPTEIRNAFNQLKTD